ncbi:MAG TPA: SusC/RagA family TonB-linked outer membrane protein [Puia sp.]|nr:SusC/RagA family TonB-linked outer membrane protein [Puia sp.]
MKFLILFLFVGSLQLHATGYAQVKINLSLQHVEIKKALLAIQRESPYRFMYNDDLLPREARVTIEVKDAGIDDVLNTLFANTSLTYTILKNNLVVISNKKEEAAAVTVNGTVQLRGQDGQLSSRSNITVVEKGTAHGTVTDDNGAFSLSVSGPDAVLEISFVGYKTQDFPLNGQANVNIVLDIQDNQLQDVVVTALGISRQKKSISYATQSLKGSELSDSRNVNVTSAMEGRVANMTINKTNAGPGSSNRIVFRGNRSITNGNQPLIVVDGVRVDNTPNAFTDVTGNVHNDARDNGDGISNINPDDIESMTVLTGASAAALYGSDASNGAIIITTKKGKSGRGAGIQISSSAVFENPLVLPDFQNVYGQGVGGTFIPSSNYSWGPQMTGQQLQDWTGKTQAFSPQPDNVKDFFQTGSELVNTASISAGGEHAQTYFSYTNTYSKGILPNNYYKRNNLNLRETVQLTPKLSLDFKANYIEENIENRPLAGAGNHAVSTLYAMPRSLRLSDIKNYQSIDPSDLSVKQNYWAGQNPSYENPYWSVYNNLYQKIRNRFLGLISLKYQITPNLSVQGRSSLDYYSDRSEEKDFTDTYWVTYAGGGDYINIKSSTRQFNNDLLLNFNKNFSNGLSLNVNAGASIEQYNYEVTRGDDQGLNIANVFSFGNGLATVSSNGIARTQKQSVYAAAELGYNNYLFLDLTGRNDWNSTLPPDHASYFFPSVGVSALLNEIFKMAEPISLLKLRASYAFVGNGTSFNQLQPSPTISPGGNGGFLNVDRVLRNPELKPEETRSFETGLEFGFLNNRFGGDITYYHTNTINQILSIPVPNPSGYAFRIINAGNIRNEGIELLLHAKAVDQHDFTWTISFNFGMNRNKILYLDSLQKAPPLASPENLGEIVAEEGKSYGDIYTTSFQRNANGQIIVDPTGLPLIESDQMKYYAGNYNPDWTAGIGNTLRYKNWSLYFLIDERKGGVVVSGTQALMAAQGTSKNTVPYRDGGFVVPNSVMQDGSKNTTAVSAQDYWMLVGGSQVGEPFINSATNIRLREASLTYMFSTGTLSKTFIKGISLTAIGRNLFFFKNNAVGFDPESALGTGNNQGLEFASLPSTRSYGLYLKLNF